MIKADTGLNARAEGQQKEMELEPAATGASGQSGVTSASGSPADPKRSAKEAALLEAALQIFGSRKDYAKPIGNWARGVQNKFTDGFVFRRQGDAHSKIQRLKVDLAGSPTRD
jgi:hypothetical protein